MTNLYGDPRNFVRITGKFFFRDGAVPNAGYVHVGNVTMHKVDPKVETKDIKRYEGGKRQNARSDVIESSPEYNIEGDEFYRQNMPLLFLGDDLGDATQASVSSTTVTITNAVMGQWYPIAGKINVTVSGVTISATALAASNYIVDAIKGLICFISGLADGDDPVVTYTAAAKTRKHFRLFSNLQRSGDALIYASDGPEDSTDPNHMMAFACDLFPQAGSDYKVDDRATWKMTARVRGPVDMYARADA